MRRAAAGASARTPASPRLGLPLACVVTTAFAGYCPVAPGTAGSLVGLAVALLTPRPSPGACLVLVPATLLLAVAVSGAAARALAEPDPQEVVIDEAWAIWAASLAVPNRLGPAGALFALFRVFDIWKPFPAGAAQRLPGGWGIVADDAVAATYAAAAYHGLAALGRAAGLTG